MKTKKLTLSAFGPYADEIVIDLEKLRNKWYIFNNRRYRSGENYHI